jgi:RHS repeat-associated protein
MPSDQQPRVDPRLTESQTVLDGGQTSKVTYSYDVFNNQTDIHEFDYGESSPKRRTHLAYNTSSSYIDLPVHLRRLVTQQLVCGAGSGNCTAGSATARSDFDYDDPPLHTSTIIDTVSLASAVQHDAAYASSYTTRGNVTEITRKIDDSTNAVVNGEYDILGNLVKITDPRDFVSLFDFKDVGTGTGNRFSLPTKVHRANGQSEQQILSAQYDYNLGRMTLFTDPNGVDTTFAYGLGLAGAGAPTDKLDRLHEVVRGSDQSAPLKSRTTFTYTDDVGSLGVLTQRDQLNFGDQFVKSEVKLDGLGRAIKTIQFEDAGQIEIETRYDGLGRVEQVSNPRRVGEQLLWTVTDYDGLGRVTSVKRPDNAEVTTAYVGNQSTVTDEAQKVRRSFTDALGRLTSVEEDPFGLNYSTIYTYDALDNLTSVSQSGQSRTFAYDLLSRLICASNPESRVGAASCLTLPSSGLDRFSYDANGNLITKTDARGVTVTQTWDPLNRIETKTYSGTPGAPPVVFCYGGESYGGGSCGGTPDASQKTCLTGVGSSVSVTNYTADALCRITASTQTTDSVNYGLTYSYTVDDSLKTQSYPAPSTRVLSYAYDKAGRVTAATDGATNYASAIGYHPHGSISQLQLGNGLWENVCLDTLDRQQPTAFRLGTTADAACASAGLARFSFAYHPVGQTTVNNGNILQQVIAAGSGALALTQDYTYDGINRLKTAAESGNWSRTYDYSPHGNRAVIGSTGPTFSMATPTALGQFDSSTNRLIQTFDGSALPGNPYDSAGNLQDHPFLGQMSYDAENRQTSFTNGGSTAVYSYDGEGRRVKKVANGATTVYVYDAFANLAAEYSTQTPAVSGTFYRSMDHLGSTRVVTNQDQVVHRCHDFFPFGERIASSVGRGAVDCYGTVASQDPFQHKFTAKERDEESGLDFFGAQYYGSSLGRFNSVDPANAGAEPSNPQSWNAYAYTLGNPLAFVDPSGAVTVCATEGDSNCTPSDDPEGLRIVVSVEAKAPEGPAEPIQTDYQKTAISMITGQVGATAPLANTLFALSTSVTGFTGGGTAALGLNLASKGATAGKAAPSAFAGVRALSQTLREAGVPRAGRLDVINSFRAGTIETVTAGSNQTALRFFGGQADEVGRFLTPTFPSSGSARSVLALPAQNSATGLAQFQIRQGAQFFRGTVAPNLGKPGGGVQFFVPNLKDLVRLQ